MRVQKIILFGFARGNQNLGQQVLLEINVFSVILLENSFNFAKTLNIMDNAAIIEKLNLELSKNFPDYLGVYFFGSRLSGTFTQESDFDVVLIFDELNHPKRLEIAGVLNRIEYDLNVFFDCKLFTAKGTKSIQYIREHVNPIFIQKAIDSGKYYARA